MKSKIKFLKRFFEPSLLDKKSALRVFAHGIIESFIILTLPLLFIPKISGFLFAGDMQSAMKYSVVALSIFIILFTIKMKYMYYWFWAMNVPLSRVMYSKYISQLVRIDSTVFEKGGTGYYLSKFNAGVNSLASTNRELLENMPQVVMNVTVSVILAFGIGLYYGLGILIILIIFAIVIIYFYREEVRLIYPSVELVNQTSNDISRIIMSRQEILYSDKASLETRLVDNLQNKIFEIEKNAYKYSIRRMSPMWVFPFTVTIIIFTLQSFGFIKLNISQLTLVILISNVLGYIVADIFRVIGATFDNYKNIKSFWEMMDEEKIKGYDEGEQFVHRGGEIELSSVYFNYNSGENEIENMKEHNVDMINDGVKVENEVKVKNVLENFNLKIKAGSKVALVGRSGSGKTTIAKLISGYMRPSEGQVIVDGQDLAGVSLKSYYKYIGYLTQEPMVFDGSIRENLVYALSEEEAATVSEERLIEILKLAQCNFILENAKGMEAQIGEKGIRLSGGERQRLAIAKLMLKDPEIIILDEPTSALDSFSEESITIALNELFKGRTVIIIAHRLQTVKSADEIIVLEAGQIVERGDHKTLISREGGVYAKMLEMQSGF
jgi:ABC-type multidrug transport system fused ATPase/permease subunit